VAWGEVDAVAARVSEHLRAGADQVALSVLSADPPGSLPVRQWPAAGQGAHLLARSQHERITRPGREYDGTFGRAAKALDADADQLTRRIDFRMGVTSRCHRTAKPRRPRIAFESPPGPSSAVPSRPRAAARLASSPARQRARAEEPVSTPMRIG
jgi:hypothetical protein